MTQPRDRSEPPAGGTQPREAELLRHMLRGPGYLKALGFCALIGIPVSLAAFWFLVLLHELEHALWADLPHAMGMEVPLWWWPFPLLLVAGTAVGLAAARLPGAGGHVPASGLHTAGPSTSALPGVLLAAVACLPFGAVLGPEAPLIALGGGLALVFRDLARGPATQQSAALLGAAGAAAAVSAIFGNPLIAAVLLIEVAGVGGPQLFAVMLPALLSSGIGALVFTGLGRWTGLSTGDLSLKLSAPSPRLDVADVLWALAIAVVLAAVLHPLLAGARLIAAYVTARPLGRTVLCALGAAACAAVYSLITDRSPCTWPRPVSRPSPRWPPTRTRGASAHCSPCSCSRAPPTRSASAVCAAAPCSRGSFWAPRRAYCSRPCRVWASCRRWRPGWRRPRPSPCGCR